MFSKILKYISTIVLPEIIVVGLDVRETQVTAVASIKKHGKSSVIASGSYELPPGTIVNGELQKPDALKNAIDAMVSSIPDGHVGAANEPVFILSIPSNHVYTQTILLPVMDEKDIAQSVKLKMDTSLPWPPDAGYADWNKIPFSDGKNVGIFIAGASKSILDSYFRVFLENGWKMGACEFHLFSLARFAGSDEKRGPFAFILVDEDGVEFSVYGFGGVLSHYFESTKEGLRDIGTIEGRLLQLTSYVEGAYGVKVESVVIFDKTTGGKLPQGLPTMGGIPVTPFVPDEAMAGLSPAMFVAYAASRRPYSSGAALLDLIPRALGGRYQENLFSKTIMSWVKLGYIVTFIFLLAFAGVYIFLGSEEEALIAQNMAFSQSLTAQEAHAAPLISQANDFNALVESVKEANAARTDAGKKLAAVEVEAVKNGLVFVYGQSAGMGQIVLKFTAPTQAAALAFQNALKADKLFTGVDIPLDQLAGDTNLPVTVTLTP